MRTIPALLLLAVMLPLRAAQEPAFTVVRPTILAFFPPVTQKQLERDPDTNETLADFQVYAKDVREPLKKLGVEFKEVYAQSFRVTASGKSTTFRPGGPRVGYYLIAPGKKPRIEYGVQTDADLMQIAAEYFGLQTH